MDLFGSQQIENGYTIAAQTLAIPQSNTLLLSHQGIEQNLLELWHANRLPHTVIFSGLKGVGKATFAYRLARFILKNSATNHSQTDDLPANTMNISPDDPVFRKVANGCHGDLLVITNSADKKIISVEETRKISSFLRQTSSEGGWQIVIIDNAEMMTHSAQNSLLKILEEPPNRTLIVLIAHKIGELLPTIRSRSRLISFSPLDNEDIKILLQKSSAGGAALSSQDLAILTPLARGSAGQGITLLANNGIKTTHDILNFLSEIDTTVSEKINLLSLEIGKSGIDNIIWQFNYIVRWWLEAIADCMATGQDKMILGHLTFKVPSGYTLHSVLNLHESVENHTKMCEQGSLDKRYMVFKILRMIQGKE